MGNDQKKPSTSQYHPDIVVVSDKSSDKQDNSTQEELNKLQYVPLFYPILKSSIELKEDRDLFLIDPESLIKLSTELKNYLASCAANATRDQDALSIEIKHLHIVIDTLILKFVEKQKKYAKYCEQFKAINDISSSLKKIQLNMDKILPMMDEINNALPDNERLEPFKF